MKVTVCRKTHFNAAHRLHNPKLSIDENSEIFGACNLPNFHGHNYDLIVKVTGEINPETGFVIDINELKEIIHKHIIQKWDHRNLNLDIPEFKDLIPTVENMAAVIWKILRELIPQNMGLQIVLYETERNFVEYHGE